MKRMPQPDRSYTDDVISHAQSMMRDADAVLADISNKSWTIVNEYKALGEENVRKTLTNIPLERLNDAGQGLRLGAIRSAGITNVAQLVRMSHQQLESIRGVGEQTSWQVMAATQSIERSVRDSNRVRLDPDHHTTASTKLVIALNCLRKNTINSGDCVRIMDEKRSQVMKDLDRTQLTKQPIRWFFSRQKTRTAAIDALTRLDTLLQGPVGEELPRVVRAYWLSASANDVQSWDDFSSHSVEYYSILESITGTKVDDQKTQGNLPQGLIDRVESQKLNCSLLKSSLRGYQEFGAKYAIVQGHTLLGDEMGLGKTVEAIAAMAHLQSEGAHYFGVVCPASVLINWCREIVQHSNLKPYQVYGGDRKTQLAQWTQNGGVAVTTYETIKIMTIPPNIRFDMLVADEAHYAKNPEAQRTQALRKLTFRANRVLFMTGTPLENRLDEMRNLISYLQPELAAGLNTMDFLTGPDLFRQRIAPVYLRRNREDVLTELPELVQVEEWVDFGSTELQSYRQAVQEGHFMHMRRVAWTGGSAAASPKLNRLLEICEDAEENDRKIVIFSFFRDVISSVSHALGQRTLEPITGSVSPARRQQIIDDFTNSPAGTALVCQVQAGGVGLNIQTASVVIICEPQIKPALETQAISRAYRMGQTHSVVVHRILTENSVDERMMEILNNKQQLFDSYARDSVVAESSLQAIDITEKSLIDKIVAEEQKRLGLTVEEKNPSNKTESPFVNEKNNNENTSTQTEEVKNTITPAQEKVVKFCTECGEKLSSKSRFCSMCGTKA